MKWARVETEDGTKLTGVIDEELFHPREAPGSEASAGVPLPLSKVTLLGPVAPGKFIGLWNNSRAAAEKGGLQRPQHPLYFFKANTSVCGPGASVEIPPAAGRVVFEGELGLVIGEVCKNISPEQAADRIFGYTCINDLTSLDVLNADAAFPQWTRAKSFDGFGVVGPVIETQVAWQDLTVQVFVNGRERQSFPTTDMFFTPAEIVSHLSHDMTLEPGDLIACGTSLGARPVKSGMAVDVVIEGIGAVGVTLTAPETAE